MVWLVVCLLVVSSHHLAVHLVAAEAFVVAVSAAEEQVGPERLVESPPPIISMASASPATSLVIGQLTVLFVCDTT
jgi:hypothetical protein